MNDKQTRIVKGDQKTDFFSIYTFYFKLFFPLEKTPNVHIHDNVH